MKNTIKLIAFITLIGLSMSGCSSPWQGDETTITINLGEGLNARAADYPPTPEILAQLEHRITMQGPTGTQNRTLSKGETKATFTVVPGLWEIAVESWLDDVLYAKGLKIEDVTGKTNTVTIIMKQPIYTVTFNSNGGTAVAPITDVEWGATIAEPAQPTNSAPIANGRFRGWFTDNGTFEDAFIFSDTLIKSDVTLYADWGYRLGEAGPGGGIIFYRSDAGFTFYQSDTDTTGITAYYLEAAPNDNTSGVTWASDNSFESVNFPTSPNIGQGKKNTVTILSSSYDPAAPAALASQGTKGSASDWFLPSRYELEALLTYWRGAGQPSDFNLTYDRFYWASSTNSNLKAHCLNSNGNTTDVTADKYNTSSAFYVRPIRAF